MIEIKPWDRLQEVLPPLRTHEFGELTKSIEQHGVLQPILALPDGRIIDGYHRWKISNGKAPYKVLELTENEAFALGIILNAARRNMSPEVLGEVWKALHKDRKQLKKTALELLKAGKTQLEVSAIVGIPRQTISDWKNMPNADIGNRNISDSKVKIPKKEYEKIYKRVKDGEPQKQVAADYGVQQSSISKIVAKVEKTKQQEEIIEKTKVTAKEKNSVICCDIEDVVNYLEPNSTDLILTDAPYAEKFVSLWPKLGDVAEKVLKPSGFFVSYCGQVVLPTALDALSRKLEYFWTAALLLSKRTQFYQRPVASYWKPILVFYKPPFKFSKILWDVVQPGGKEKTQHPWQQALSESKVLIETFTSEGDLVVDPLCGSGTSLLAAKVLKRRYLGFDHDEKAVKTARARLTNNEK